VPALWMFLFAISIVLALARLRWEADAGVLLGRLRRGRERVPQPTYDPGEIRDLPAPVRRFFESALVPGCPFIGGAELAHEGTIRLSPSFDVAFVSTTKVIVRRPGFLWQARLRHFSGLLVHDAYVQGEGSLDVGGAAGFLRLQRVRRRPGLAEGQLLRYLAEAPWYPTALLPRAGVHWDADGESSARATLVDGLTTASLLFHFGDDGLVARVRAEARGRQVRGKLVPQPWEGRFAAPRALGPYTVPHEATVAWVEGDGEPAPYWSGRLIDARYD